MNLPNQLTIGRIFLILIFLILANVDDNIVGDSVAYWSYVVAYVVAVIAGVTDFLDGYIARKYNLVSDFGKLMDPLADKIFVTATLITLAEFRVLPAWVAVIIISREFMVTGLRLLATQKGEVISADKLGKIKTVYQMVMLAVGGAVWVKWISFNSFSFVTDFGGQPLQICPIKIIWVIGYLGCVLITVYSGVGYFIRHKDLYIETIRNSSGK